MKKTLAILLAFCMIFCISACSRSGEKNEEPRQEESAVSNDTEEKVPLYAKDIKDGTYNIEVDCNTSMFRVVNCELTVENGKMHAVMTMSGQGFGAFYMGTGEEALADSEDNYIPAVLNENGEKTFTVPVEALDMEIDCAALSVKKNTWYDHFLTFKSDGIPQDALK